MPEQEDELTGKVKESLIRYESHLDGFHLGFHHVEPFHLEFVLRGDFGLKDFDTWFKVFQFKSFLLNFPYCNLFQHESDGLVAIRRAHASTVI